MLLQDWVDDILPEVPTPLDSTVEHAVRQALTDFCRYTGAWKHTETTYVEPHIGEYEPLLPEGTLIRATDYAIFNPERGSARELISERINRLTTDGMGKVMFWAVSPRHVVFDAGNEFGELEFTVKLNVTRDIEELPDDVFEPHFDTIRHGALAHLQRQPGKPWTDKQTAQQNEAMYREGRLVAKREVSGDVSMPRKRVRFNRDFRW